MMFSSGKVKGKSELSFQTNIALDEIKKRVYNYKERILNYKEVYWLRTERFLLNALREKWFGEDHNTRTLLGVFRLSILDLEKIVAKGIYQKSTLVKYKTTGKHLVEFIQEKGLSINSSGKMIKNLKKAIRDCVDKEWLDKDPLYSYKEAY